MQRATYTDETDSITPTACVIQSFTVDATMATKLNEMKITLDFNVNFPSVKKKTIFTNDALLMHTNKILGPFR